jgi:hypothetical protein
MATPREVAGSQANAQARVVRSDGHAEGVSACCATRMLAEPAPDRTGDRYVCVTFGGGYLSMCPALSAG